MRLAQKLRDLALVAHALEGAGMAPQMDPRGLRVVGTRQAVVDAVTDTTRDFGVYDAEEASADPLILRFRHEIAGFDVSVVVCDG